MKTHALVRSVSVDVIENTNGNVRHTAAFIVRLILQTIIQMRNEIIFVKYNGEIVCHKS